MKYVLMMHTPRGSGEYEYHAWKPEDWEAHLAHFGRLNADLKEKGELVDIVVLTPPAQAKLVRAGSPGMPVETDGPFPETKEFLAGYWLVDVESAERAYEIAGNASDAPGPGGAPLRMLIEVRQLMQSSPPVL
ncbi:MAG: YciI family protein [bacterium]